MSQFVRQKKSQRKHPIVSSTTSLLKGPAVPVAAKERPGWKGPAFIKKGPKQQRPQTVASSSAAPNIQEQSLPLELQQLLLNIFRTTFPVCQEYEMLKPTLREINNALLVGDHEKAYSQPDWLEAYTVRWSPNRALCYASILVGLCEEFPEEPSIRKLLGSANFDNGEGLDYTKIITNPLKMICFGGNAAEVMAVAAMIRHISPDAAGKPIGETFESESTAGSTAVLPLSESTAPMQTPDVHLVDIANWVSVISALQTGLVTAPTLSKYASAAAKANNASFLGPEVLKPSFQQINVFDASQEELTSMIGAEPALVTIFFTLNDLRISSVTKTATFLLKLTLAMPRKSLLLVVDPQDVPSEDAAQNSHTGEAKPMYSINSLLDMVLMEKHTTNGIADKPAWTKLVEDRSRLFKLDEKLKYPLSLENIKLQVHLFKRQ
ncbi:hypothetical protein BP5796_10314 [Coleophoma crateriformis]|uniref:25S rRNA (Uridine(2843)-N(3))-methyltransferase n=1 Tax=Coleophoma crateriformis TaxID=565419 RepID=A0A3D8QV23_9HELO|nr:hypothetical protein BP5796_10314 [Coleophoma crateriformis]